jgi:hypothetical protein
MVLKIPVLLPDLGHDAAEATVLADVIGIRRYPRQEQEQVHVATVGFPVAAAVRGAVRASATTLTQL